MRLAGFGLRRPKAPNPGRSLAGTVESAGQEVTGFKPGDEVYGTCGGSFAPYARAQAGRLAPKPANLSFAQAAAVPVSALTALQAVRDQARVQPGQKVLIVGCVGRRRHVRRADCQGLRAPRSPACAARPRRTWSEPSANAVTRVVAR
jgi:D-arabinose 1-dehydrogenase-like Zn-dependent alcohol dehydrogenase